MIKGSMEVSLSFIAVPLEMFIAFVGAADRAVGNEEAHDQ